MIDNFSLSKTEVNLQAQGKWGDGVVEKLQTESAELIKKPE